MSDLRRLGTISSGGRRGVRYGGGPSRRGLLLLVLVGMFASYWLVTRLDGVGPSDEQIPAGDEASEDAAAAEDALFAEVSTQQLLGVAGPVELRLPAMAAVLVSFHEASLPQALEIVPAGRLAVNGNVTRFIDPGGSDEGAPYNVQVSRGRANSPTSAVDIVLEEDQPVLAPVAGVIVEVRDYELYNTYADVRLELRPDGASDHAVVLIHVRDVVVTAGQHVELGEVLAGGARVFPFDAVVDRETAPRKLGHVHLEVKHV